MTLQYCLQAMFSNDIQRKLFKDKLIKYPFNDGQGPSSKPSYGLYENSQCVNMLSYVTKTCHKFVSIYELQEYQNLETDYERAIYDKENGDFIINVKNVFNYGLLSKDDLENPKIDIKIAKKDPDPNKTKGGYSYYFVGSIEKSDVDVFNKPNCFFFCVAKNGSYAALVSGEALFNYMKTHKYQEYTDKNGNTTYYITLNNLPENDIWIML